LEQGIAAKQRNISWQRVRRFAPAPYELAACGWSVVGYLLVRRLPVSYALFTALGQAFRSFWYFLLLSSILTVIALLWNFILHRKFSRKEIFLKSNFASPFYWVEIVRISLASMMSMLFYFLLKSSVYLINPRNWDRQLFDLDQNIHFGISPNLFFLELFNNTYFYRFMDLLYSAFYFIINLSYPALILVLAATHWRRTFATAYVLMWSLGCIGYLAVPCYGPVFTEPDQYEAALQEMPITAYVQNEIYKETLSLVRNPEGERIIRYGGIAAFPSLHVGLVALFTLVSRTISKRWFHLNLLILFLLILGSLITGYHYLIDDYAGLALAGGLYYLSHLWIQRWERRYDPIQAEDISGRRSC
jgi:hypothetical protein